MTTADAGAAAPLEILALGDVAIRLGGADITSRIPAKAVALLVYLVDEGGAATRSRLAGLLWSDQDDERARTNLRIALTRLRREVGSFVEADRTTIRLAGSIDADVSVVVDGDPEGVLQRYRGDLLVGVEFDDAPLFDDWAAARRAALRHRAAEVLMDAASAAELRGDDAAAMRFADGALAIDTCNEVAHRIGIRSSHRRHGRSEALARYDTCRAAIERELGLEPEPDTQELAHEIETGASGGPLDRSLLSPGAATDMSQARLVVPPTPFFGRVDELEQIRDRVGSGARVVTLVGPGGAGKTRLAERAADLLRTELELQVAAELHGVSDGARVVAIVANACGVPPGSADALVALVDHLGGTPRLLVIDNAEEVFEAVGALCSHLVARCPALTVLVTSRIALGVSVEHVVPVDGLSADRPDSDESPPVELFVERARRLDPSVAPDDDVRTICDLVGGLPLAIELAARWVGAMSVAEIAGRLSDGVELLESDALDIPERQRSMRRVLDLTWAELDTSSRDHMAQLSVFRGGFDLVGAEAVAGTNAADLQRLASRSLLRRVPGSRFEMHELIRQHAAAHVDDVGSLRDRHARHVLDRVIGARAQLLGASSASAVARLTRDFDNVVAAWNHVLSTGDVGRLVDVAPPLSVYSIAAVRDIEAADLFRRAGRAAAGPVSGCMLAYELVVRWRRQTFAESTDLFRRADAVLRGTDATPRVLRWRAVLANAYATTLNELDGKPEVALEIVSDSLVELHTVDDPELMAELELTAGRAEGIRGHFAESERLLDSAAEGFELLGNTWGAADAIGLLAATYAEQYRVWEALQADRRALALWTARRDEQSICTGHANLGSSLALVGAWDDAAEHTSVALQLALEQSDPFFTAYLHCQMGEIAAGRGDREEAEASFLIGIGGMRSEGHQIGLRLKLPEWARHLVEGERWIEAELVVDEARAVCDRIGGEHFLVTADAIRSRWLLGVGRPDDALEAVNDVWQRIEATQGRLLTHPIQAMADCVAVFEGLGDERMVSEVRAVAQHRIRDVIAAFDEPRYRQTYLRLPYVAPFLDAAVV